MNTQIFSLCLWVPLGLLVLFGKTSITFLKIQYFLCWTALLSNLLFKIIKP